jgi:hypothetical protein
MNMRRFQRLLALTAALLVAAVAVCGCQGFASGTAASSKNLQISKSQMNFFCHNAVKEGLRAEYLYINYGLIHDVNGVARLYRNADEYASAMLPERMKHAKVDFSVCNTVQSVLAYCEYALEAGLYEQFKAETEWEVNKYMEDIEKQAKDLKMSLYNYLVAYYGSGSQKDSIRQAKEYLCVAEACREKLTRDYEGSITSDDAQRYVDEHKDSFYTTSYASYTLTNVDLITVYGLDECKSVQEVRSMILRYYVDTDFDILYRDYFTPEMLENADKEQIKADVLTTVLVLQGLAENGTEAVFSESDTDPFKKSAYAFCQKVLTRARFELTQVRENSARWVDPASPDATSLQKWLFSEGRKSGDVDVVSSTTTHKDSTTGRDTVITNYTWVLAGEDIMKLDTDDCREVYYHLFQDDAEGKENHQTAAQKAEAFLAELKAHPIPKLFDEFYQGPIQFYSFPLANIPTSRDSQYAPQTDDRISVSVETSSGNDYVFFGGVTTGDDQVFYSEFIGSGSFITDDKFLVSLDISPSSKCQSYEQLVSKSKDLAKWVFHDGRKSGDITSITTEKGVYVALYVSDMGQRWEAEARSALAEEKMAAHLEELLQKYSVRIEIETVEKEHGTTQIVEVYPIG